MGDEGGVTLDLMFVAMAKDTITTNSIISGVKRE
jgi:hypothetical protein